MHSYINSGGFVLLLLFVGCQTDDTLPQKEQRLVYDYRIDVEETAMSMPQRILSVQTGRSISAFYSYRASAYLFIYSKIYPVGPQQADSFRSIRRVPQDTLTIVLTRPQTDTIYSLAQRIFALPQQAVLRDSLHPPVFSQLHDTDPYLSIKLRLNPYRGPAYECTGYREENGASYNLHDYLLTLQRRHLKLH
ncbi:hypothetical protein SAMN04488069_101139 [Hymenobacter psychrophilus]|uniref:Uncharacterized protein n=1 Tax=Hymenobacter psychrophilus TaxID=651662 RepID=A0A1H3B2R0_9BACT|nr:hypothetical protein SAMN04488069_101139 [Hymenobacter psychrophilus]